MSESEEDFKNAYVESVMRGMKALGDKLFPPDEEIEFAERAQKSIDAGKNKCVICEKPTFEMAWPQGWWLCKHDAQAMWKGGATRLIMNMKSSPEERRAWLAEQKQRKAENV